MRRQGVISVAIWLMAACVSVPVAWAGGATATLESDVSAHPNDYQAWFRLGVAYSGEGHLHQAIEAFRQVIALRPDLAEPHNNLAVIYNEVGDVDSAVQELKIALQKQPGYVQAEENLADLYLNLAIDHYHHVLVQAPNPALSARYERLLHVRDPLAAPVAVAQPAKQVTPVAKKGTTPPGKQVAMVSSVPASKAQADTPPPASSDRADVMKAFEGWRAAWSARDLDGYFSAYSSGFVPNAHMDHAAWKRYKRRVIMAKDFIHVGAKHVVFRSLEAGKRAQLVFDEHFESNDYREDARKVLDFAKINGAWKITRESDQ